MRIHTKAGLSMLVVLLCLAVASILMMVQIRSLLNTNNVERHRMNDIQARSIAAAAIDRAIRQIELSADFQGEVWEVTSEQIVGSGAGRVTIAASTTENDTTIEVVAIYPVESTFRSTVRRTKRIVFESPTP
jgi:hypothetical protein